MLLTISTTHRPATDLGYLLVKNPARSHSFNLKFGTAHVLFPEATDDACTAALLVDVDVLSLSQRARRSSSVEAELLSQYVNDRPYAASSFLSVVMTEVFSTAMSGRSRERPELATTAIPLSVSVHSVAASDELVKRLFEPLGYEVMMERSDRFTDTSLQPKRASGILTISGKVTVQTALEQVYVLIPVMDNRKHYWIGSDEVTKLLDRAGNWLPSHPERDLITKRYLRYRRALTRDALERLAELDSISEDDEDDENEPGAGTQERTERLSDARLKAITEAVKAANPQSIVDMGCGEGRLLAHLRRETEIPHLVGVDASSRSLEIASRRLRLERQNPSNARASLLHGALTYADRRLTGFDVAIASEVLEHIDADRLPSFERAVFEVAAPGKVVMTTPNREYNVLYEGIESGRLRHRDHRFEFTRKEFSDWCEGVAARNGYSVDVSGIGEQSEEHGQPTQMAVFTK